VVTSGVVAASPGLGVQTDCGRNTDATDRIRTVVVTLYPTPPFGLIKIRSGLSNVKSVRDGLDRSTHGHPLEWGPRVGDREDWGRFGVQTPSDGRPTGWKI